MSLSVVASDTTLPGLGKRVQVTVEGFVNDSHDGQWLSVGGNPDDPSYDHVIDLRQPDVSIAVLPDPEPDWYDGDIARDSNGSVWVYQDDGIVDGEWRRAWHNHDPVYFPTRPLVRLVPEKSQ